MNFITNILKVNLMLNCCLLLQTAYKIKTEEVYEDFYQNKNVFDFSDYPWNLKLFYPAN